MSNISNELKVKGKIAIAGQATEEHFKEIFQQTALSLLDNWQDNHSYHEEDIEFILYFATLIGRELDLPPNIMSTLKYGPLLGSSAKMELDSPTKTGDLTRNPFEKIAPYLSSPTSVFVPEPEERLRAFRELESFELEDMFVPDHLSELEAEIDLALDILIVADAFNRLLSTNSQRRSCSVRQAIEVMKQSSTENFNPTIVTALTCAIEKESLSIH